MSKRKIKRLKAANKFLQTAVHRYAKLLISTRIELSQPLVVNTYLPLPKLAARVVEEIYKLRKPAE